MTERTAQRVVLVVVAAAAVLWLAHGLRALSLDAQGRDKIRAAGARPSPARVASAVSLFKRAARLNADPTPEIDEATLLLRLGREREAAAVLEGVVGANSGNVRALTLLASATARLDPQRSANASGVLRSLFGGDAAGVYISQQEPLIATSQRVLHVVPNAVLGSVETSRLVGDNAEFTGWAGSPRDRRPASSILVLSNGRLVAEVAPRLPRPDIARAQGVALGRSGFVIVVSLRRLEAGDKSAQIQLYGSEQQVASPLPFDCSRPQRYGCAR